VVSIIVVSCRPGEGAPAAMVGVVALLVGAASEAVKRPDAL
jgi:hypothetical protein